MRILGLILVFLGLWLAYKTYPKPKSWMKVARWVWVVGFLLIGLLFIIFGGPDSSSANGANDYQLGRTFVKSKFKSHDGLYYTVKNSDLSDEVRYFVSDKKVTAAKIVAQSKPINGVMVQNDLETILGDDGLKYTNSKENSDDFLLKDQTNTINIYSPKHKKWFHFEGQIDDGKYSSVSVYPGKSSDGE